MVKKILLGLAIVIALLLGYVAVQPPTMDISRELLIKASPETLFPYINNSKKADSWMPWSETDPEVKTTYSGPEEGIGSTSSWTSPGQMGDGKAVVVESRANQVVKTQLNYTKPMVMSQLSEMTLTPTNDGTIVKWRVTGEQPFIGRLFCLVFNMEKTVGGEFEKGLNKLKSTVEVN